MKSLNTLRKDERAVFGLTSVQQFFAIILGIALLAYVIVVIMGTLSDSTLIPTSSLSATVVNESGGYINSTGYTFAKANVLGFVVVDGITAINASSGQVITSANYTLTSAGVIKNATALVWNSVNITYTYSYNTVQRNNANSILTNTSAGISGFFGSISPVYSILAILVIILVLVVLVRVVSGGTGGGQRSEPQL